MIQAENNELSDVGLRNTKRGRKLGQGSARIPFYWDTGAR